MTAAVTVAQTQSLLGLQCLLNIKPRMMMITMSLWDRLFHQVTQAAQLIVMMMMMMMKGVHKMMAMMYV